MRLVKVLRNIKDVASVYLPNPNRKKEERLQEVIGERKTVFSKPAQKLPFYSLYRVRNQGIAACVIFLFLFSTQIHDIYNAWRRGNRLEEERAKYIALLDAEDEKWEAMQAAQAASK